MTDKELLEFAAKAAGYRVKREHPDGLVVWIDDEPHIWNPLTDDGDALRLAVKLGILDKAAEKYWDIDDFSSPDLATRRAIVRAAAETMEGMK